MFFGKPYSPIVLFFLFASVLSVFFHIFQPLLKQFHFFYFLERCINRFFSLLDTSFLFLHSVVFFFRATFLLSFDALYDVCARVSGVVAVFWNVTE